LRRFSAAFDDLFGVAAEEDFADGFGVGVEEGLGVREVPGRVECVG
jgi:hypothetical protein